MPPFFFKVGFEVFLGENTYEDLVALNSDRSFNTRVRKAHVKISCQSSDMMLAHPCQQTCPTGVCAIVAKAASFDASTNAQAPNQNVTT